MWVTAPHSPDFTTFQDALKTAKYVPSMRRSPHFRLHAAVTQKNAMWITTDMNTSNHPYSFLLSVISLFPPLSRCSLLFLFSDNVNSEQNQTCLQTCTNIFMISAYHPTGIRQIYTKLCLHFRKSTVVLPLMLCWHSYFMANSRRTSKANMKSRFKKISKPRSLKFIERKLYADTFTH
jgi:hypothetical protein